MKRMRLQQGGMKIDPAALHRPCGGDGASVVPEDLRVWFPASILVSRVLDAVSIAGWEGPALAWAGPPGEACTTSMALGILIYSYSTGRFASEDIEVAIGGDPSLAYLSARRSPTAECLRRFRRRHRALVLRALEHLLTGCLTARREAADAGRLPGMLPFPLKADAGRRAREEAERRIDRAVLEDAVAADV